MLTLIGALTVTCSLLVVVSQVSEAQSVPEDQSAPSASTNENVAQVEDAKAYAAEYGVSEREALRRLELQVELG